MHILITDSGVGGLSVVAYAERYVRTHGLTEPVRLTFANAAPANDYGYNSMPSREVKIETFDRFLRNVTERYAPDRIYVACNTLSVLLPFVSIPAQGIVETGVRLVERELEADPRSVAIIFGTQTTIDSGAYPRMLAERGIDPSRIVSQACPGLADTISEDRLGEKTRAEIRKWVDTALAKLERRDVPIVACLACTHYGYRKDMFRELLPAVIDPNESAVDDLGVRRPQSPLSDRAEREEKAATVQFVTRYPIPEATIETLTFFLQEVSPRTVDALRVFQWVPDLF